MVLDGGKSYVASGPVKSEKEARKKWDDYIELLGFPADEFEIIEPNEDNGLLRKIRN